MALCIISAGTCLIALLRAKTLSSAADSFERQLFSIRLLALGALLLVLAIFRAGLCILRVTELVSPGILEVVVIHFMILIMCVSVLSHPYRACKIIGYSLEEAFGDDWYDSDSGTLMIITMVVVVSHLGLPVRWASMVLLELAAVLLYAALAYGIGSSESPANLHFNMFTLVCVVVTSAVAKRFSERDERQSFSDVVQEKSRRCEAEFRLSQVDDRKLRGGGSSAAEAAAEPRSHASTSHAESSVPETAESAGVFEPLFEKSVDVEAQLARVAEVGNLERWKLEESEVTVMEKQVLGSGSFGTVLMGVFSGTLVAVKRPRLRLESVESHVLGDICNEIRVLRHLRHPHIVTTFGAIVLPHKREITLVLELIEGVQLTSLLLQDGKDQRRAPPSLLARYQVMLGVCQALLHMHTRSPRVVHGDLQGNNIMVEMRGEDWHPKLLDFGLSRVLTRNVRALGGTLAWLAPEVLQKRGAAKCSADVYSFGHVLAFTATGRPPCDGMIPWQVRRALRHSRPPLPTWPDQCAFRTSCAPLVLACLSAQECQRPPIQKVFEKLSSLPQEEALADMRSPFVDKALTVARQMRAKDGELAAKAPQCASPEAEPELLESRADSALTSLPEGQLLPGAESEQGLPQGHQVRRARVLPYPDLDATSTPAMHTSMDAAMARWNYKVPKEHCCEHHALVRLAYNNCACMLAQRCSLGHRRPRTDVQCENCGILGLGDDGVCDICGHDGGSAEERSGSEGESSHTDSALSHLPVAL